VTGIAARPPPGGNGKIAFTSNRDGNNQIYVMNADGSGGCHLQLVR
jgi:Tol biopolymer transport system component